MSQLSPKHRVAPFYLAGVLLAAVLCLGLTGRVSAAGFTVTLDRNAVSTGERVTLTMTFEGGKPRALPAIPQIPNLTISGAEGQSQSYNLINGVMSSSDSYTFSVTPTQPGDYTIPALTVELDGQPYNSQPLKLSVKPAGEITSAFLKLIVPATNVYLGQVLPVEIQVYFQNAQGNEPPKLKEEGFTIGKIIQSPQTMVVVNNQRYAMLPLKTYVVPVKAGDVPLGPATMPLRIPVPGGRRNIFNEIIDWQAVTLRSAPITLHVLPVPPENAPTSFTGAVGSFSLSLSASPTNIAVGDPITVTIEIAGQGPVEAVTLPAQDGWRQFKLYPPTSEFTAAPNDPVGITGTKTFKLTAVPESMDIKSLPAFSFSFFDPFQKTYRTLTQPEVPLIVRPSAASLPPPIAAGPVTAAGSPANQEIAHIKARPGVLAQVQPLLIQRPWFVALQSVPVIAWLALLVSRRQKERIAGNPRLRRRRLTDHIVRNGFQDLRDAADANNAEAFFALVFRLLQEQLGERLDVPASAITDAIVDEKLRALNVPEETLGLLTHLFQSCNQERYGRQSTNEELVSLVSQVEQALEEIRHIQT